MPHLILPNVNATTEGSLYSFVWKYNRSVVLKIQIILPNVNATTITGESLWK